MPDAHLKRMACQIAAQLPDDADEAVLVLDYVKEIVANLGGQWSEPKSSARLYVIQRTSPAAPEEGGSEVPRARLDIANPG